MKIVDDVIPIDSQEYIKNTLFDNHFPWFFIKDITTNQKLLYNTPGFEHVLVNDNTGNSEFYNLANLLINSGMKHLDNKISRKISKCHIARAFLQMPLHDNFSKTKIDQLHVDINIPHYVLLYYVSNNDAETLITKTKYNSKKTPSLNIDDHEILEKVVPKQGRMVLFDGKYYHTASQPKNDVRCVININLL